MASRRGPQIQTLSPDDRQRLDAIRHEAAGQQLAFLDREKPEDALGALAWVAGAIGSAPVPPLDIPLAAEIRRARLDKFTWRQIAAAIGEGDSADDARRVRDRFSSVAKG